MGDAGDAGDVGAGGGGPVATRGLPEKREAKEGGDNGPEIQRREPGTRKSGVTPEYVYRRSVFGQPGAVLCLLVVYRRVPGSVYLAKESTDKPTWRDCAGVRAPPDNSPRVNAPALEIAAPCGPNNATAATTRAPEIQKDPEIKRLTQSHSLRCTGGGGLHHSYVHVPTKMALGAWTNNNNRNGEVCRSAVSGNGADAVRLALDSR